MAVEPVYVTNEAELVELMGPQAYAELVAHCEAHLRSRSALALHPASPPSPRPDGHEPADSRSRACDVSTSRESDPGFGRR